MLCRFFLNGTCKYGDQCRYSHQDGGPSCGSTSGHGFDGKAFDGKGKWAGSPCTGKGKSVCSYFLAGNCQYGESCRFSHDTIGRGKKGAGKKGKKCGFRNITWSAQGQAPSQSSDFAEDGQFGKGPGPGGALNLTPPPPGVPSSENPKTLTGPYLGKGSELLKVWSMPDTMGHEDAVLSAVVMGDRVCTGGADHRLLLWRGDEQPDGGLAFTQDNEVNFPAAVTALYWHAGSKFLFCGLEDGQIRAFRQEPLAELIVAGHTAAIMSMIIHEGVLLTGSVDGTVRAWKYDDAAGNFSCAASLLIPLGPVYMLHLQLPGALWVGAQRGVSVLSLSSLQVAGNIDASAPVVAILPYAGSVIVAFGNGTIKVFDAMGNVQFSHGPLGEHTTNTSVSILRHPYADKDILVCGQEFGYVTVYDIPEFKPRGTFTTGYLGQIASIVDMGAGGLFATVGDVGDVVLWRWERSC